MGFHLDSSQHVHMDPLQILCIISHLAYIPALMILWERRYHYHIPFGFLVLMLINSVSYHFCLLTEGTLCVFPLGTQALFDHITAEYTIVLIFILFLYASLKGLDDSLWILAGFLLFFGILALWRMRGDEFNPLLFGTFIYLDTFALLAYYLYEWYDITHPIWHVLSGLDLMVALIMLLTSKRNRVLAELQKVYPESHIAFDHLTLKKQSDIPFWEVQRETNTVIFYMIAWPYSLYMLLTRWSVKEMNLSGKAPPTNATSKAATTPKRKQAENNIHLQLDSPEVVIIDQVVGPDGEIIMASLTSF